MADEIAGAAEATRRAAQETRENKIPEAVKDIQATEQALARAENRLDDVVGKRLARAVSADQLLSAEDIEGLSL